MDGLIHAGKKSQVRWGDGNWIILDIGFSSQAKSCGLLHGKQNPCSVTFGNAKNEIIKAIRSSKSRVNLVVEAPLSVHFDPQGNPKGRTCEKEGAQTRYWYVGPGSVVMVAAMYLIRAIFELKPKVPVRLFEGFVSFRNSGSHSDGKTDVLALRDAIRKCAKFPVHLYSDNELKADSGDCLISAFRVADLDCGVPAVIKCEIR